MIRRTFDICRDVILGGAYVREDMMRKLDRYLLYNRVTQAEYDALMGMMTPPEVEQ